MYFGIRPVITTPIYNSTGKPGYYCEWTKQKISALQFIQFSKSAHISLPGWTNRSPALDRDLFQFSSFVLLNFPLNGDKTLTEGPPNLTKCWQTYTNVKYTQKVPKNQLILWNFWFYNKSKIKITRRRKLKFKLIPLWPLSLFCSEAKT